MKKFLLATCAALMLSLGLFFSNSALFTSTAEAKALRLEYKIYLEPGETYQIGYGTGYTYNVLQGGLNNFTVSKTGLVTASYEATPNSNGYAGDIFVYDRFYNNLEFVHVYIVY